MPSSYMPFELPSECTFAVQFGEREGEPPSPSISWAFPMPLDHTITFDVSISERNPLTPIFARLGGATSFPEKIVYTRIAWEDIVTKKVAMWLTSIAYGKLEGWKDCSYK